MDALDRAIYDTAHDYPGGVPALAQRMAVRAGTLNNKVDSHMEGHRLNVYEALAMMLTTGDKRILYALAQELHHTCVPLGDFSDCSDMEVLDKVLAVNEQRGKVDATIKKTFSDNVIKHTEKLEIRREMQALFRAWMELYSRIDALAEAPEAGVVPLKAAAGQQK